MGVVPKTYVCLLDSDEIIRHKQSPKHRAKALEGLTYIVSKTGALAGLCARKLAQARPEGAQPGTRIFENPHMWEFVGRRFLKPVQLIQGPI